MKSSPANAESSLAIAGGVLTIAGEFLTFGGRTHWVLIILEREV